MQPLRWVMFGQSIGVILGFGEVVGGAQLWVL
jgi:hypothetical protein